MPTSPIEWRAPGDREDYDPAELLRLETEADEAVQRLEEVVEWPLTGSPPLDREDPSVAHARQRAIKAKRAVARYRRRQNHPLQQYLADLEEDQAQRWSMLAGKSGRHKIVGAYRWNAVITDLLASAMSEGREADDSAVSAESAARQVLWELIQYGRVCRECGARTFTDRLPSDWICKRCRRWQRRLRPYPDLPTKAHFEELLRGQGGMCKICGEADPPVPDGKLDGWHIDHDHVTGRVRGILCHSCNVKVGKHEADRDARGAIEDYLNG